MSGNRKREKVTGPLAGGPLLAAISNSLTSLMREFGGRGPTATRTHWLGEDGIAVVMEGGFTPGEQTLYEHGKGEAVRWTRLAFQDAVENQRKRVIEGLTQRKVIAFMSSFHQDPDIAVEVYMFDKVLPGRQQIRDDGQMVSAGEAVGAPEVEEVKQ